MRQPLLCLFLIVTACGQDDTRGGAPGSEQPPPADTTPPVISGGQPEGVLPGGTSQVLLRVTTDEAASCRHDAAPETTYAAMTEVFAVTGATTHETPLTGLTDGLSYTRFVRCSDAAGNAGVTSYAMSFSVGTDPGPIAVALSASRTSGVAPLYVFFDASGTTSTGSTQPFFELRYTFSFGDPAGGATWAYGPRAGVPKNLAFGPLAAHVFEVPGAYTVTVSAFDGVHEALSSVELSVLDPEVVFAGTQTLVVANGTDFTGKPSGAAELTSSDFDAAINSTAQNGATYKRILFRRGDTFTSASGARLRANGPGLVGAFGSGQKPRVTGTHANAILGLSGSATPDLSDWRIVDLEIDLTGGTPSSEAIEAMGGMDQVLMLRLDVQGSGIGIDFDGGALDNANMSADAVRHHIWDEVALVDSTVTNMNDNAGLYMQARRLAVMGNRIEDIALASGHIVRFPYIGKGVLQHNQLSRPTASLSVVKLHGPAWYQVVGDLTAGSNLITNLRSSTGSGDIIDGADYYSAHVSGHAGIPANAYQVGAGSTKGALGMSVEATQTATGVALVLMTAAARGSEGYTEQVILSENVFTSTTSGNSWAVALAPQSGTVTSGHDDRLRRLLVERNWFRGGANTQNALRIAADFVTARNNLFDLSDAAYAECIVVTQEGIVPAPHDVWLYHNTGYSGSASGAFTMVTLGDTVTDVTVINNLAYAPLAGSRSFRDGTGAAGLVESSNSSAAQIGDTSPFASSAPSDPADFALGAGSYAIDAGASTPVLDDFFAAARPVGAAPDLGIAEAP